MLYLGATYCWGCRGDFTNCGVGKTGGSYAFNPDYRCNDGWGNRTCRTLMLPASQSKNAIERTITRECNGMPMSSMQDKPCEFTSEGQITCYCAGERCNNMIARDVAEFTAMAKQINALAASAVTEDPFVAGVKAQIAQLENDKTSTRSPPVVVSSGGSGIGNQQPGAAELSAALAAFVKAYNEGGMDAPKIRGVFIGFMLQSD
ncbi:hypothetical protein BV898_19432 [Hypsibius exemplaris]|uniref:Uncharacterized protein n=1 Tax=Hypsibius exemplaris TaxID=2072580 RepID=A0A9X6NJ29_HYPEX|nr:hypothetical protein BV898_19432 [Hypsibius exemplaris]